MTKTECQVSKDGRSTCGKGCEAEARSSEVVVEAALTVAGTHLIRMAQGIPVGDLSLPSISSLRPVKDKKIALSNYHRCIGAYQ